jgi:hypothetical protein
MKSSQPMRGFWLTNTAAISHIKRGNHATQLVAGSLNIRHYTNQPVFLYDGGDGSSIKDVILRYTI